MRNNRTITNNKRAGKPDSLKILEKIALDKLKERYPNNPYYPKATYTDATTNGLTKCVIDYVNFLGYQAERINSTGAIKDGRKTSSDVLGNIRIIGSVHWIKGSGKTGTSDISATIKGRSIKIEIKCEATGDNYQSIGQIEYQKQIERAGGVYIVVRNFTQFYDWFIDFVKK